ncbi:MAG: hypothetical protein AAF573_01910 [Bacteroidota bacterium]
MKKSNVIFVIILSMFCYQSCVNAVEKPKNNAQDTTLDDIVESPPEKKVNQAPEPETKQEGKKVTEVSTPKKNITTGRFLILEEGDYYYLHMKDEKNRETTFQIWEAYEGAAKLNVDNWEQSKGKRISVTWEEVEENVPEAGKKMKIKKVLGVDVLD